jgi:RimJ/RimL family protein N-acetyltransferase
VVGATELSRVEPAGLPEPTARLRFRRLEPGDLPFLASMLGDAEVMRHYPHPLSRAESAAWLVRQRERYARDGHGLWLLVRRDDGAPLGQVGLLRQDIEGRSIPEIGYLLARNGWHLGYATEGALAVRAFASGVLRVPRVYSLIRPANLASQAVARRLGMTVEREVAFHGLAHRLFSAPAVSEVPQ